MYVCMPMRRVHVQLLVFMCTHCVRMCAYVCVWGKTILKKEEKKNYGTPHRSPMIQGMSASVYVYIQAGMQKCVFAHDTHVHIQMRANVGNTYIHVNICI